MLFFVYVTAFSIRDAINNLNSYNDFPMFSIEMLLLINIKQVKIHFENKEKKKKEEKQLIRR